MSELAIYPTPCEIDTAIPLLKEGKRITRKEWMKNGIIENYLKIEDVGIGNKTLSHILFSIHAQTGVQKAYSFKNDDLYAKWYLIKEET